MGPSGPPPSNAANIVLKFDPQKNNLLEERIRGVGGVPSSFGSSQADCIDRSHHVNTCDNTSPVASNDDCNTE